MPFFETIFIIEMTCELDQDHCDVNCLTFVNYIVAPYKTFAYFVIDKGMHFVGDFFKGVCRFLWSTMPFQLTTTCFVEPKSGEKWDSYLENALLLSGPNATPQRPQSSHNKQEKNILAFLYHNSPLYFKAPFGKQNTVWQLSSAQLDAWLPTAPAEIKMVSGIDVQ